jgi:hypothetical protein
MQMTHDSALVIQHILHFHNVFCMMEDYWQESVDVLGIDCHIHEDNEENRQLTELALIS